MYAGPRPTVELVVPSGYRGVIKAEVQIQEDAPCQPGQRYFSYEVSPSGAVQVAGPALLRRVFSLGVYSLDVCAKYADGTVLSRDAKDAEVGCWWLKCEGSTHFFLVGTRKEYDALRHSEEREGGGEERRPSGGGRGEGRGRRGRGGSQSSSSSGSAGTVP
jgi:hypothetical protein